jgi:hypothetical protein
MKLFLDSEFTALRQDSRLISLALVAENGEWFYAEFTDFPASALSDWHRQNVIPNLFLHTGKVPAFAEGNGASVRGDSSAVSAALKEWLGRFERLEVWADALAYDWVLFCELFGGALNLPGNIFYLPFDFVTFLHLMGKDPDARREELAPEWVQQNQGPKHNALYDAFLLKFIFQKINAGTDE